MFFFYQKRIIEFIDCIWLVIIGLGGGFASGLLGIGGGPIYVLLFGYYFSNGDFANLLNEDQAVKLTIANTTFCKLFAGLFGCIKQIKMDNFYPRSVITIAAPAIIISISLSIALSYIEYSKQVFSILFIILLVPLLIKMIFDNKDKKKFNQPYNIKILFLNLTGAISGTVAALSGLGGGFTIIPLMNSLFNIKIRKVFSISLGVIFCVSLCLTIFYLLTFTIQADIPYSYGAIVFSLSLPIVAGLTVGTPLGVHCSRKLSPYVLRMLFIIFCIIVIAKTLFDLI